ncbi:MAG: toll/interleukin-1 receptor domain-containing protein [Gammaproteobacteria bacterium]|nr:toll/interleukin-1 receptor domain-containing protein [Gammaproteobacteria bacterium]
MDNPLEQAAPEEPIARVHAFARDLAWGAAQGLWGPGFRVARYAGGEMWLSLSASSSREDQTNLHTLRIDKWQGEFPESDMLQSFGYFEPNDSVRPVQYQPAYLLTQKAFALIDEKTSAVSLKVFISHKQDESSEFASLIEAQLEAVIPGIHVFVDKDIRAGDVWLERIEQEIRNSDVFICLFGPTTPESQMVQMEVQWAMENLNCRIVPIWHHGYTGDSYPPELNEFQRIEVPKENAEGYSTALQRLFFSLGRT